MNPYARSRIVGDLVIPILVVIAAGIVDYLIWDWTMRVESAAAPVVSSVAEPRR